MTAGPRDDRGWMELALALAALGEGTTRPNPRVGCVLVRDGRAVGAAFHRASGEPHAEFLALDEAAGLARGATLYVNLEPCAHHGRTPPCTGRIIEAGVRRVVASLRDPNPLVDGRGFGRLREAGVQVETGLLAEEARRLNRPFLHWHETGRPWVTLKAAASLDGMLGGPGGPPGWITGPVARRFAHRLRLRHDAVLVGAETVRRDNPRLTVRLEGEEQARLRVVLASRGDLDPDARIFEGRPGWPRTRVYVPAGTASSAALEARAEVRRLEGAAGRVALEPLLADLARDEVQSVLVEGGGRTLAGFLEAGVAQAAAIFLAPVLLGARGGPPMVDAATAPDVESGWRLADAQWIPLQDDVVTMGVLERTARGSG